MQKRRMTLQIKENRIIEFSKTVLHRVKRHLKLPTFMMHRQNEVYPLLLEAPLVTCFIGIEFFFRIDNFM